MAFTFVRISRAIHVVSAFWTLVLGVMIVVDVVGRAGFSSPLPGAKEIIQNSVVAITFLQLPLAILTGSMLRTTLIPDALAGLPKKLLRTVTLILGAVLFVGIAVSSWQPALDAFRIGEYEGEGALRVATWPVRFLLVVTSVFAAAAYLLLVWLDWREGLDDDDGVPARLQR